MKLPPRYRLRMKDGTLMAGFFFDQQLALKAAHRRGYIKIPSMEIVNEYDVVELHPGDSGYGKVSR